MLHIEGVTTVHLLIKAMLKRAATFLVVLVERNNTFFVVIKKQFSWTVYVSKTNFSKASVIQENLLNLSSNEKML